MYQKSLHVTQGTVSIQGSVISYTATAESFLLSDAYGNEEATTYTFSYERTDNGDTSNRPVLFAYNGGPGAASAPMHILAVGPRRMRMDNVEKMSCLPPFEMEDNHSSILDICDLVVYDPPGTGFNHFYSEEAKRKYYSANYDADAAIDTIRQWLTAHKRWNSPVFILGESYGSVRSAIIADRIMYGKRPDNGGYSMIQLSGVILAGPALCFGRGEGLRQIPDEVINFTAITAANWYHRREKKPPLRDFVKEADHFAYYEYLPALTLGSRLPTKEKQKAAERISYFTDLPVDEILSHNLKIDRFWYAGNGFSELGISLGINDSRFSKPRDKALSEADFFESDPTNFAPIPAMVRMLNHYIRHELHVESDREYNIIEGSAEDLWDYQTKLLPGESLRLAMLRNPGLRVLFCLGYYDLITTMGQAMYSASRFDLPSDRVDFAELHAGHMPYLGRENCDDFNNALRAFILRVLAAG